MIAINSQILDKIFLDPAAGIDALIVAKQLAVRQFRNNPTRIVNRIPVPLASHLDVNQISYLDYLDLHFDEIVKANSSELVRFKNHFDGIITGTAMKATPNKEFRNELIKRMGYGNLRDDYYPEYFEKIGIKTCIYCNSQLSLTVRNVSAVKKAKFQVDHYYSKSEYPCFSISFYNLYPTCGPCNNSKSDRNDVNFNLYSGAYKDYNSSAFKFVLDKKSLVKYRVNGIDTKLEIKFIEPLNSGFNNAFAIEGIYNTQKDIAEELVIKSMIYNEAYCKSLKNALLNLYKEKAPMLERLMAGNYTKELDIHKRPMAKFTQDIAKQLGLI